MRHMLIYAMEYLVLADIFLQNNNENCILSWSSTRIKRIVKSSTAAECLALIKGIEETLYLKALICDILKLKNDNLPTIAMIDNKNLHALINSNKLSQDKRVRIHIAVIKEIIRTNAIQGVRWIQSTGQLTNCLTKRGADGTSLVELLKNEISIFNNKEAN